MYNFQRSVQYLFSPSYMRGLTIYSHIEITSITVSFH